MAKDIVMVTETQFSLMPVVFKDSLSYREHDSVDK